MRILKLQIRNFRSIENVTINFPKDIPVVLFGPNNVGKSNILKSLEIIIGERYPASMEFLESDHFLRDKKRYPKIFLSTEFDENYFPGNSYNPASKIICFTTNLTIGDNKIENTYHYPLASGQQPKKMYLSNEDKEKCSFLLVDASRDISRQFSYSNQYTVLSKMAKNLHSLMEETEKKELTELFDKIKQKFESIPIYHNFLNNLLTAFDNNIDGFDHKLSIDLSTFNPNNLYKSLQIMAHENGQTRSFDEFGTGEQQILLMSFIKAYAETFKGESYILGIEEPEAHLHPIAQKWLANNVRKLSTGNVQVIISTHSPEFLDIECLEGFVKVYKENGITKVFQNDPSSLANHCISLGAKTSEQSILGFYKTSTFYDHLRGFFARKIILVEGETELFALPNYFNNCNYNLTKNGVEIINCHGKSQIARYYRLFTSYKYQCFCLFDADTNKEDSKNTDLASTFNFDENEMEVTESSFTIDQNNQYGYFGSNIEKYFRSNVDNYKQYEQEIVVASKQLRAKNISEIHTEIKPEFIEKIAQALSIQKDVVKESDN